MRRKDREITDEKHIDNILSNCKVCRLAFNDNGAPYIVPMNFGYEHTENTYTLYFHCAKVGRKIDLAKRNTVASFEADTFELVSGKIACEYTAKFESVIGHGKISVISDGCTEEKRKALDLIMKHYTDIPNWEYGENMLSGVCILKLEVEELSCKANV